MKKLVNNTDFWVYMDSGSAPVTIDSSTIVDSFPTEPPDDALKHSTEGTYSPSTQAISLYLVSNKYQVPGVLLVNGMCCY